MTNNDVITAIEMALEKMDRRFCTLSKKDYSQIDEVVREHARKEKYLERPIAYEFYHQIRRLLDDGTVDFGGPIIQAEVDKTYQHCFEKGKIPDFIIHVKNAGQNLAVIEFKLATNLGKIKKDLEKLVEFKKNEQLKYAFGIEVILGNANSLTTAKKIINRLSISDGEEITLIDFNTDSWKANRSLLRA